MVNLTRIYTRSGDRGTTHLGSGEPVSKTDPRVEAIGAVDEVNAAIGVALAAGTAATALLEATQNDLFDLGADLAVAVDAPPAARPRLRVTATRVEGLETAIDAANADLAPLRSFVLPGGGAAAAALHLARTVCRRAERRAWALVEAEGEAAVNPQVLIYLNRLSDLLFVLARAGNARTGAGDRLWRPGGEDGDDA